MEVLKKKEKIEIIKVVSGPKKYLYIHHRQADRLSNIKS